MALLEILKYPDPRLRVTAQPVTKIDDDFKRMVEDMYETMYDAQGVGLAATQVNIHLRFFTMDVTEERDTPVCIINPEIVSSEGSQLDRHGCLSVGAHINDKIKRAAKLHLKYMDIDGKHLEMDAEGLTAICIQHEVDHLNGILFIDHFSRLKQDMIRRKIEKNKRMA